MDELFWYKIADKSLLIFHALFMVFNMIGWAWHKTQKINLITLLITASSWFILGIFYGIGYCPLTDLHWEILHKLGQKDLPSSYVKYLADSITGLDFNPTFVEYCTAVFFFSALGISLYINFFGKNKIIGKNKI